MVKTTFFHNYFWLIILAWVSKLVINNKKNWKFSLSVLIKRDGIISRGNLESQARAEREKTKKTFIDCFTVITTGPCPADHKFAYFYGQMCCNIGIDYYNEILTFTSLTCRNNARVDCPTSNCTSGKFTFRKVFIFDIYLFSFEPGYKS